MSTTAIEPIKKFSLDAESWTERVKTLMPHGDAARFIRMVVNAVAANEFLLTCDPKSLYMAAMNAAQTGLEPDPQLGQVYFVPRKGKVCCQIGYKGFLALAYRSDKVISVHADIVRVGDKFEFQKGTEKYIRHTPAFNSKEKFTHTWAMATLRGGTEFDVMSIEEVDVIRKRSAAGDKGPWASDYAAMVKKTVVRRLCKMLPMSTDLQRAITIDEEGERDEPQTGAKEVVTAGLKQAELLPPPEGADDLSYAGKIPE